MPTDPHLIMYERLLELFKQGYCQRVVARIFYVNFLEKSNLGLDKAAHRRSDPEGILGDFSDVVREVHVGRLELPVEGISLK